MNGRGRGRSNSRGGGRGGRGSDEARSNKQDRKGVRRAKQLETMEKKAAEEDRYFRQCQKEASLGKKQNLDSKEDLFGKQGSQGINFAKYDAIKVEVKPPSDGDTLPAAMMSFQDLTTALPPQLQKNIELMNYKIPTPIQKHAIPLAMQKHDLMCCAQTGSGKTCAFLLPVCASLTSASVPSLDLESHHMQPATPLCVVLAPTRELALQIQLEARKLTYSMSNDIVSVCVYGGANPRSQLKELATYCNNKASKAALVVVATPGRLTDFVDRSIISLAHVQYLILDEADRMLDMGFEPQIRKLVLRSGMTPKAKRQTLLFSATFPPQIQKLAAEFLCPYVWIAVGRVGSTTDSITQVFVQATNDKRSKLQLTVKALLNGPTGRTLIFVQKKRTATWLKKQLSKGGPDDGKPEERFTPITAGDIHGDRSQSQREAALASFRAGEIKILVATDVAARGLDINGVEHVINFDLPSSRDEFDSYVHRIGRTGRAGHVGLATSLFVPGDDPKTGNGRIVVPLIQQLKEAGQTIPAWLEGEVSGGGGGAAKRKQQFGGNDVRKKPGERSQGGRGGRGRGRGGRNGRGRA